MRYGVRWTEELLIKALFRFHPELANDGHALRRVGRAAQQLHPRGRRRALPAARSPGGRASASGPRRRRSISCARRSSSQGVVTDVIVVVMPKAPDRDPSGHDLHPGRPRAVRGLSAVLRGPRAAARCCTGGRERRACARCPTSSPRCGRCGLPLEPVFAGGERRTSQEREQWSSACNFLAVRPGTVVSYRRNDADPLRAAGARASGSSPRSTSWRSTTGPTPSTVP